MEEKSNKKTFCSKGRWCGISVSEIVDMKFVQTLSNIRYGNWTHWHTIHLSSCGKCKQNSGWDKHYTSVHKTCLEFIRKKCELNFCFPPWLLIPPPWAQILFIYFGPRWYFCIWLIWLHICFQSLCTNMFSNTVNSLSNSQTGVAFCTHFSEIFITALLKFEAWL